MKNDRYKQYSLDKSSFIGGWYMPEEICDELIETFNNNKTKWQPGAVGPDVLVKEDIKQSTEFVILPDKFHLYLKNYIFHLNHILENYKEMYPHCSFRMSSWTINNTIKIQHYKPGEGFKEWHCENNGSKGFRSRHLVFMTYLTNTKNAGTEFYHQNITTPCEKGLTVIWPAGWTHLHKGVISENEEKTIITGWYDFNENN